MNRDAKGRFCKKASKKVCNKHAYKDADWGSDKCCKHKCDKKLSEEFAKLAEEDVVRRIFDEWLKEYGGYHKQEEAPTESTIDNELLSSVSDLMESVQKSIDRTNEDPETLEEVLETLDRTLEEVKALKIACETLIQIKNDKEAKKEAPKKCTKKSTKCKGLPKEIVDLAEQMGIPIESIQAAGSIDLDTGEEHVYKRRQ